MRGRGLILVLLVAVAATVVARERGWAKLDSSRVTRADADRILSGAGSLRFTQTDGVPKLPPSAADTVVRGMTPTGVEELLRVLRFEFKAVKGEALPTYAVAYGAYNGFLVLNDKAADAPTYTALQFYASFKPSQKPTLQTINGWNRQKRFCRVWAEDDDSAIIAMDLDLERGITKGTIEQALWIFTASATRFAEYLEPKPHPTLDRDR